jgi:hypothetical protein
MYKAPVLILTLLAITSLGQSPSKILKQAEKALGGAKALQSRNSLIIRGRITRLEDKASGQFQMETSRPNLYHLRYDIAGDEVEFGYNGRSAWRRTTSGGLETLSGKESLLLRALASYRNSLWLNAKAEKIKIGPGGYSTVRKRNTTNLLFTTPKGISIKVYFDDLTGLPIREDIASDWSECIDDRMVNGVKVWFQCLVEMGGIGYEINIDEARSNETISQTLFDFPRSADAQLPDLDKLLAELQANQDRIENLLDSYSYTRKTIGREVGKDGSMREIESETDQMSFYKGYRIERKIEKNGKPLTPSEQADEDKAVAKRAEEIEKRLAKAATTGSHESDMNQRSVSIAELLRASRLINPRRERFRGRDVIVFDFEPNPSFDLKNAKSMLKFFGKTAGVIWADENDKQTVRVEAYLADDFSIGGGLLVKLKKGATFVAEQERINDEIWLPSIMEINLNAKVLMLKGLNVNQLVKAYDYRKFQTEVKDAKVNEVQKP